MDDISPDDMKAISESIYAQLEPLTAAAIEVLKCHEFHMKDVLDSRRICVPWPTAKALYELQKQVHEKTGQWYTI